MEEKGDALSRPLVLASTISPRRSGSSRSPRADVSPRSLERQKSSEDMVFSGTGAGSVAAPRSPRSDVPRLERQKSNESILSVAQKISTSNNIIVTNNSRRKSGLHSPRQSTARRVSLTLTEESDDDVLFVIVKEEEQPVSVMKEDQQQTEDEVEGKSRCPLDDLSLSKTLICSDDDVEDFFRKK
jgi:hypothetical protein